MSENVELLAFVKKLRQEIIASQSELELRGDAPIFVLEKIELNLTVGVEKEAGASGGFRIYCISLGGSKKDKDVTTHQLKLVLAPVNPQLAVAGNEDTE